MRTPLWILVAGLGCQHIPAGSTHLPVDEAPPTAAAATVDSARPAKAERFELALEASQESSCSQSWAYTQWSGSAELLSTPEGTARLELQVSSTSTGGAWNDPSAAYDHGERPEPCAFEGHVTSRGGRRVFELSLVDPAQAIYECRPAYRADPDAEESDPWVLDCAHESVELPADAKATTLQRVPVLTCRSRGNVPWLWRFVEPEGEVIRLGLEHRVHAAGHDSDSLMGELAGVSANQPRQWVAP